MAGGTFGGGDGTINNPYLVEDASDFMKVNLTATIYHYKQTSNIDFTGVSPTIYTNTFNGTYDGNGFKLSNYTLSNTYTPLGIFPRLGSGTLKNIVGENISITNTAAASTSRFVGGLVGQISLGGTVEQCKLTSVNVTINDVTYNNTTYSYAGGLVGTLLSNGGTVKESSVSGVVRGGSSHDAYSGTGGLVGHAERTVITACSSSATVIGFNRTGGLIGGSYADTSGGFLHILDSYSTGDVTGTTSVGGLVGYQDESFSGGQSFIKRCYASGIVKGDHRVGGLVGVQGGSYVELINSYCLSPALVRRLGSTNNTFHRIYAYRGTTGSGTSISNNHALSTMEFREE